MNYNKVILAGNLTRDPQLSHLPSNTAVAEFGIAVNRKWRDQQGQQKEEVAFIDCRAFGKTAETINQHFAKGKPIFVEGRLKFDSWEGKDGGKRSKLYVVVDTFQFVGKADGGDRREQAPAPQSERYAGDGSQEAATVPPGDDIPF